MTKAQILVVEDEIVVAESIRNRLGSLGYDIPTIATSGEEAIEKVGEMHPNLVLMDIKLAGDMDGIEAAEQIRDRFNIPVIYLTAFADDETLQRAKLTGPYGYILKPLHARDLRTNIEMALYKHRMESKLRASEEQYRQSVENSPNPIFSIDREGTIQTWNRACEQLFQHETGEIVGQAYHKLLWNPEDLPAVEAMLAQVWQGHSLSNQDMTYRSKDGTQHVTVSRLYPLCDPEGNAQGCVFANTDITERRQAETEARRQAERLTVVNRIARATGETLHLDDLIETVYREVTAVFQADALCIAFYDAETNELDYLLQVDEGVREPPERHPLGTGLTSRVIIENKPLLIRDMERERERLPPLQTWGTMKIPASWLGVPMQIEEQVTGVTCVQAYRPYAFDEDDQLLLSTIADQVAVAVKSARLFQAEQEQRELAEALAEAAAAVNTLDLDQVLDRILEQVERIVAGDAFNVMLLENGIVRAVRWRGYEHLGLEDRISRLTIPLIEYPNLVRMAETGEPIMVIDTATEPDWIPEESRKRWRSYVGAPIRVEGKTVGFLNVNGTRSGQFGPDDARRLQVFADHTAAAVANARLHQAVLDHAGQLERRVRERTAQLMAQYARLEAILHSTADGIIGTDENGRILQVNPVARTWLTHSLPRKDANRLRKTVQDLARRAAERPRAVLELTELDLELKTAPISKPDAEVTLPLVEGEPAAVVAVHDISEIKALDRIKTNFIRNASHELRTPIATITLYAHLMQRVPPEDERWNTYLDALVQAVDDQAQMGEAILQLSRIYAGQTEIKQRPTPLNELAETAASRHQSLAKKKELILEHRLAKPGPVAAVDTGQMMQVLNNLVRDAIRYTPEGNRIVVTTGQVRIEGYVWATMAVSNTGEQIPEGDLPHIFERLFREGDEEPRSQRIRETGLRLMVAKEVVGLHGGQVTVESQEDRGTTFTIWLPLAD